MTHRVNLRLWGVSESILHHHYILDDINPQPEGPGHWIGDWRHLHQLSSPTSRTLSPLKMVFLSESPFFSFSKTFGSPKLVQGSIILCLFNGGTISLSQTRHWVSCELPWYDRARRSSFYTLSLLSRAAFPSHPFRPCDTPNLRISQWCELLIN